MNRERYIKALEHDCEMDDCRWKDAPCKEELEPMLRHVREKTESGWWHSDACWCLN